MKSRLSWRKTGKRTGSVSGGTLRGMRGRRTAAVLLAAVLAAVPFTSYGFEMKGEYYEISCQEAGAYMFDGTTVKAGTTGELVLSRIESSWAEDSSLRTTDFGVLTARVVPGDNGLNVIEYTAKSPGSAQLIVVVESGAAVNMGTFYVVEGDGQNGLSTGWVQEDGRWHYRMGDGSYKSNGWLSDAGIWYYLGEDGIMYANRWLQDGEWWYYLGTDGAMMKDGYTLDGSWVNSDGVWEPYHR